MIEKTATRYSAHGWTLNRVSMPRGGSYMLVLAKDSDHSELGITAFYTKGRVLPSNITTGKSALARTPGILTQGLGQISAGTYEFWAEDDSEWWCFDKKLNAGQMPQLQALDVAAGSTLTLQGGKLALVCSGSLTSRSGQKLAIGETIETAAPASWVAAEDSLVLVFDRPLV